MRDPSKVDAGVPGGTLTMDNLIQKIKDPAATIRVEEIVAYIDKHRNQPLLIVHLLQAVKHHPMYVKWKAEKHDFDYGRPI